MTKCICVRHKRHKHANFRFYGFRRNSFVKWPLNALLLAEYAPSPTTSKSTAFVGISTISTSHCAMIRTQYTRTRPKYTHHPFTTSGFLHTIEIEFQVVRHFRRTFFPAFSFIVIPYLYQMYHRENTTELNTDVLIVVGFFFLFPPKMSPASPSLIFPRTTALCTLQW